MSIPKFDYNQENQEVRDTNINTILCTMIFIMFLISLSWLSYESENNALLKEDIYSLKEEISTLEDEKDELQNLLYEYEEAVEQARKKCIKPNPWNL